MAGRRRSGIAEVRAVERKQYGRAATNVTRGADTQLQGEVFRPKGDSAENAEQCHERMELQFQRQQQQQDELVLCSASIRISHRDESSVYVNKP